MKKTILIIIGILAVIAIGTIIFLNLNKSSQKLDLSKIQSEIFGVSGTITSIGNDYIIIKSNIPSSENEPIEIELKVFVGDATPIYKLEFPDPATIKKDEAGIQPKQTEITINDLKVNDKVNIEVDKNISENIKTETPFTASTISVITE